MKIGIPKEIKTNENRVSLVPAGAEALVAAGHTVYVEKSAGDGSGFDDAEYTRVGAKILDTSDEVWKAGDMIIKVKEPIAVEWPRMRKGQTIFTYFHFAADEALTKAHLDSGATCIAYETVELTTRELPLLTPMSEVAGRMAVQEGAKYLEKRRSVTGMATYTVPKQGRARKWKSL
jgi:alanine dehydrogenase